MRHHFRFVLPAITAGLLAMGAGASAIGDEAQVNQVLDKAIKALGGEEKLSKLDTKAYTWKNKGKLTIEGNESEFETATTIEGDDHARSTFEGDFNGNKFTAVSILNGDKGWREFGGQTMDMDDDAVKNEKRTLYLMKAPALVVPLKSKKYKVETAPDETHNGKSAAVLKVTGPDGKDFTLSFDKETGLPVHLVATVLGWMGEEYEQDTSFEEYKDYDGVKRPTKTSIKRNGEPLLTTEVVEFKALDTVPPDTFSEPK